MSPAARCPSCGSALLVDGAFDGRAASCGACGAELVVEDAPPPPSRAAAAPPDLDPSPADGGDVPPPVASGAGRDVQLPLAVAAASLVLPLLGPVALWLLARTGAPLRSRGGEEPATIRHARVLAWTGTVLLALAVTCLGPAVLVMG